MCVVFADQMAVARASGRRGDVARLWIRTIGGMTSAAWREHRSTGALALGIAARSPRPSRLRVITVVGRDLRFAARSWRKTPAFTVAALGTLALCFGANVTIFAAVNAILLRPLPFPDADRLVAVFNTYPRAGVMDDGASVTNYYERRGRIAAFTGISLYRDDGVIVGGAGATEREFVTRVSPDFFATLGIAPSLGRAFDDAETTPGADHAVILTDGYWRERFGSDRAVVGRTMRVNGSPFTIVGVLPPEFSFLSSTRRLYLPLSSRPQDRGPAGRHSGSSSHMLARLAPGVSIEDAQAQVDADNAARADQYPGAAMIAASGFRSIVVPLHASHVAAIRPALLLLQGGVLCLLLIGLVNVANLLLVRASARDRELSVRRAVGAGTADIAASVVAETTLLTLTGGLLGLAVAAGGVRLLAALGGNRLPLGRDIALDAPTGAVAIAIAAAAGLLLGTPLAWYHLRSGSSGLAPGSRGGTAGPAVQRTRHAFLIAQVALSLVLLSGSALLGMSLRSLMAVSPGFRSDQLTTGQVSLPALRYGSEAARLTFIDRLTAALSRQPGVASTGIATNVPFSGSTIKSAVSIQGRPVPSGRSPRAVYAYGIGGNYLAAMGIPLLEGRLLTEGDARPGARVCVVDEDFARRYWPQGGAVSQKIFPDPVEGAAADAFTIVGVVASVKQASLSDDERIGAVYYPYSGRFDSALYVVTRVREPSVPVEATLRRVVRDLDPELPVNNVRTMEARIDDSLAASRSPAVFAAIFAAIALALTTLGTYGVVSYAVERRRREIGLRMALGARPDQVRTQFVVLSMRLLATGLALGAVGSWFGTQLLRGLIVRMPGMPGATVAAASVVLAAICLAACLVPARRAARTSPMDVLRSAD